MSGLIPLMPIPRLRAMLGAAMRATGANRAGTRGNSLTVHMLVSTCEYLKDAQRWHYIKEHDVDTSAFDSPAALQGYVDKQIEAQQHAEACDYTCAPDDVMEIAV